MTDDEFLTTFEAQRFSRDDWTHEAHVRMTWLYAQQESGREACYAKVRDGIWRLNRAISTDPTLFHETVTRAFAQIIYSRAMAENASTQWPEFRDANRDLIDPGPSPILKYYTEETLKSDEARVGFVSPDLQPLPG